jgi:heat shock protein HslJ
MRKRIRLALIVAVAVGLLACVPPEGGLTEDDVAGFWVLVDGNLRGEEFPLAPGRDVTLRLDADGELGGTSACNSYFGTYDLVASIFDLGAEVGMTTMECNAEATLAESSFHEALRLVDSAALTGSGNLHLVGEQADLLFEPTTDPGPVPPANG